MSAGGKGKDFRRLIGEMAGEWKWLLRYVSRYKFTLAAYVVIGFLGTMMALGGSVATKYLIDAVVGHDRGRLPSCVAAVAGLAVFGIVFQAFSSRLTSVLGTRAQNEIRLEIFSRLMTSRWEFVGPYHSGDLLNRLEGDVGTVSSGVISFIPGAFTKTLQFVGSFAIVLYYDKVMALLALASAPFLFFSSRYLLKAIRKYNRRTREVNGRVLAYSEEAVQNLQTVKAFDLTKRYVENFSALLGTYRDVKLAYDKFSIILTACLSLIGLAVSYLCYGWGVYRLWKGEISFGTMTLFLQLSSSLTGSFGALASLAPGAVGIATSAGRIMEVTSFEKETDEDGEKAAAMLGKCAGEGVGLRAENVSFRYADGDETVISDLSFDIKPGETVAVVGPSGEGKTTLLRLLLGLVSPAGGSLELVAPDGETLTVSDSTRRFCSYVPQTSGIFSGTVRENLLPVRPEASEEELREALGRADLLTFVDSLPMGTDTSVGERGAGFSQGQLQRLSIARALLKDAPLLILDEATSALDAETEKNVISGILGDGARRTVIITTHRQSLLEYCDKVYTLDRHGRLAPDKKEREGTD